MSVKSIVFGVFAGAFLSGSGASAQHLPDRFMPFPTPPPQPRPSIPAEYRSPWTAVDPNYAFNHWASTTRPFPNAVMPRRAGSVTVPVPGRPEWSHTFNLREGVLVQVPERRIPYEIGIRNQTVGDLGIAAAGLKYSPDSPLTGAAVAPWAKYKAGETAAGVAYKEIYANPREPISRALGQRDPFRNLPITSASSHGYNIPSETPRLPQVNAPRFALPPMNPPRLDLPRMNAPSLNVSGGIFSR